MNKQQILERRQRGYEIAQRFRIQKDGEFYIVPGSKAGKYKINLFHQTCTCPDYETHKVKCKHIYGVEFFVDNESLDADNLPPEIKETPKKKTYPQPNWKAYHQSQVSEKIQFQYLLNQLCHGIETPQAETGRKRFEFSDLVYAMVFKVYSCFSSRRFMSDLHEAFGKEYLKKLPHYNTIINAFSFGEITPILIFLIEMSSLPLASIETDFAVDSTGVSTCRFFQWYQAKYFEHKKLINKRDWVKIHLCCGVKTNIVSAVEISDKFSADSPHFKSLVDKTALRFTVNEVSADKAYSSENNMRTVLDYGGMPFIAFRSNASATGSTTGQIFKNMYHYYSLNQERFLEHYHKRSNVETVFMMIKTKFGDALRSKTSTAMVNEALCKVLAHNLCCLITSIHEFGLKPKFWNELNLPKN